MSDVERELVAALRARSASVTPDPDAWDKHLATALAQPVVIARRRLGLRRVLPMIIAAAVVVVAAVGTTIVVANNGSSPASAPTPVTSRSAAPATKTSPIVDATRASIPVAPPASAATFAAPAPSCSGDLVGSAELKPVGVNGFTARLQLRRTAGGDLLCAGITGAAGAVEHTSTGGTVAGSGPLDLAASSTWDQGSPVFVWGAVDGRVSGVHITGPNGKPVQVQFAALPAGLRGFLAVLPANSKTVTAAATDANGRTLIARRLVTTFGTPDALTTSATTGPTTSVPPPRSAATASDPSTTGSARTAAAPPATLPTIPATSTTAPPRGPINGCDGPGTGVGIADLGVGSGMVSLNYVTASKILCFSNGGPLRAALRVPGAMPYAARTELVSGQGVWGAVTPRVATVTVTDDDSPKGRPAQLLPLGKDLKIFVEPTAGPVRLQAFGSTGELLSDTTPS